MGYGLDKVLKVQVIDKNGNVIFECVGNEGIPVFYDSRDEETD